MKKTKNKNLDAEKKRSGYEVLGKMIPDARRESTMEKITASCVNLRECIQSASNGLDYFVTTRFSFFQLFWVI